MDVRFSSWTSLCVRFGREMPLPITCPLKGSPPHETYSNHLVARHKARTRVAKEITSTALYKRWKWHVMTAISSSIVLCADIVLPLVFIFFFWKKMKRSGRLPLKSKNSPAGFNTIIIDALHVLENPTYFCRKRERPRTLAKLTDGNVRYQLPRSRRKNREKNSRQRLKSFSVLCLVEAHRNRLDNFALS